MIKNKCYFYQNKYLLRASCTLSVSLVIVAKSGYGSDRHTSVDHSGSHVAHGNWVSKVTHETIM